MGIGRITGDIVRRLDSVGCVTAPAAPILTARTIITDTTIVKFTPMKSPSEVPNVAIVGDSILLRAKKESTREIKVRMVLTMAEREELIMSSLSPVRETNLRNLVRFNPSGLAACYRTTLRIFRLGPVEQW